MPLAEGMAAGHLRVEKAGITILSPCIAAEMAIGHLLGLICHIQQTRPTTPYMALADLCSTARNLRLAAEGLEGAVRLAYIRAGDLLASKGTMEMHTVEGCFASLFEGNCEYTAPVK